MQINSFQTVDILQLISFIVQLKNIEWDQKYTQYVKNQIQKLHQQNDIIMQQNKLILEKLDKK